MNQPKIVGPREGQSNLPNVAVVSALALALALALASVGAPADASQGGVLRSGDAEAPPADDTPASGIGAVSPAPDCTLHARRGTNADGHVSGTGTAADPFVGRDAPERLVAALAPGEVGCVGAGTYNLNGPGSGLNDAGEASLLIKASNLTLQGEPGAERPTIVAQVRVKGNGALVRGLAVDGSGGPTTGNASNQGRYGVEAGFQWYGDDGAMLDNEIFMGAQRDPSQDALPGAPDLGTCSHTGSGSDPAMRLLVRGNWFHNCGVAADFYDGAAWERQPTGSTWTGRADNHCLYSNNADEGRVENNLIHDCAENGVNLYPGTTGGTYRGNVVARAQNAFSVQETSANLIANNVLANPFNNTNIRRGPNGSATVRDNCAWLGYGRTGSGMPDGATGTLVADPRFANLPPNTAAGWGRTDDDYAISNAACEARLGVEQTTSPNAGG